MAILHTDIGTGVHPSHLELRPGMTRAELLEARGLAAKYIARAAVQGVEPLQVMLDAFLRFDNAIE